MNSHFAVPTDPKLPEEVRRLYRALPIHMIQLLLTPGRLGVRAGLGGNVGDVALIRGRAASFAVHDKLPDHETHATVSFGHGVVGLLLRCGDEYPAVVHGFKAKVGVSGSQQQWPAEACGAIPVGSALVAVNGISTRSLSFDRAMDALNSAARPMTLKFLRDIKDEDDESNWIDMVRTAFLDAMVSLLRNLPRYLSSSKSKWMTDLQRRLKGWDAERRQTAARKQFDTKGFISSQPEPYKHFCSVLVKTSAFDLLLQDFCSARQAFENGAPIAAHDLEIDTFWRCIALSDAATDKSSSFAPHSRWHSLTRMLKRNVENVLDLDDMFPLGSPGTRKHSRGEYRQPLKPFEQRQLREFGWRWKIYARDRKSASPPALKSLRLAHQASQMTLTKTMLTLLRTEYRRLLLSRNAAGRRLL